MCIDPYIYENPYNAGTVETVADGLNATGRKYWQGRSVILVKEGETYVLKEDEEDTGCLVPAREKNLSFPGGAGSVCACFFIGIGCLLINIPPVLCSIIGIPAKQIAIATDENAERWNKIREKYLLFAEARDELTNLNASLDNLTKSLSQEQVKDSKIHKVEITKIENNEYTSLIESFLSSENNKIQNSITEKTKITRELNEKILLTSNNSANLKSEIKALVRTLLGGNQNLEVRIE